MSRPRTGRHQGGAAAAFQGRIAAAFQGMRRSPLSKGREADRFPGLEKPPPAAAAPPPLFPPLREQHPQVRSVHDAIVVQIAEARLGPVGEEQAEIGAVHDAIPVEIGR